MRGGMGRAQRLDTPPDIWGSGHFRCVEGREGPGPRTPVHSGCCLCPEGATRTLGRDPPLPTVGRRQARLWHLHPEPVGTECHPPSGSRPVGESRAGRPGIDPPSPPPARPCGFYGLAQNRLLPIPEPGGLRAFSSLNSKKAGSAHACNLTEKSGLATTHLGLLRLDDLPSVGGEGRGHHLARVSRGQPGQQAPAPTPGGGGRGL